MFEFLIAYHGSGHGAPEHDIFIYNPQTEAHQPLAPERIEADPAAAGAPNFIRPQLGFVSADREGGFLYSAAIDGAARGIARLPLSGEASCLFGHTDETALYWPRLAPGGRRLGFLETPDEDYPPHRGGAAMLRVLEWSANGWVPLSLALPAANAPFDWGIDDETVFLTTTDGTIEKRHLSRAANNMMQTVVGHAPTIAPQSGALAWADGRALHVRLAGGWRRLDAGGPIRALCWLPDDSAIVYAEAMGQFATEVKSWEPEREAPPKRLFRAAEIFSLGALQRANPGR